MDRACVLGAEDREARDVFEKTTLDALLVRDPETLIEFRQIVLVRGTLEIVGDDGIKNRVVREDLGVLDEVARVKHTFDLDVAVQVYFVVEGDA